MNRTEEGAGAVSGAPSRRLIASTSKAAAYLAIAATVLAGTVVPAFGACMTEPVAKWEGAWVQMSPDGTMLVINRSKEARGVLLRTSDQSVVREVEMFSDFLREGHGLRPNGHSPGGAIVIDESKRDGDGLRKYPKILALKRSDGQLIARFDEPRNYKVLFDHAEQRALVFEPSFYSLEMKRLVGGDAAVHSVNLVDGKVLTFESPPFVSEAVLSNDGRFAATGKTLQGNGGEIVGGHVRLWDAVSGREIASFEGYVWPAFSGDGTLLLLWSLAANGMTVVQLEQPQAPILIPNATGAPSEQPRNGLLMLYDPQGLIAYDPKTLAPVFRAQAARGSVKYSGDEILLALNTASHRVVVHEMATGRELCAFGVGRDEKIEVLGLSSTHLLARIQGSGDAVALYEIEDANPPRAKRVQEMAALRAVSGALAPLDRTRAQTMFSQGFELFKAGEYEAAAARFTSGLEIDPANGVAHFFLAETYARMDKRALARKHYRLTADLAPDTKEAAIAHVRLGR